MVGKKEGNEGKCHDVSHIHYMLYLLSYFIDILILPICLFPPSYLISLILTGLRVGCVSLSTQVQVAILTFLVPDLATPRQLKD